MTQNSLQHWGIKGMRWGVRKSASASRVPSADHVRAQSIKKKHISEMSNEELSVLTKRLQLEKQLRDLSPDKISIGKKIVSDFAANYAKNAIEKALSVGIQKGGQLLKDYINKKFANN